MRPGPPRPAEREVHVAASLVAELLGPGHPQAKPRTPSTGEPHPVLLARENLETEAARVERLHPVEVAGLEVSFAEPDGGLEVIARRTGGAWPLALAASANAPAPADDVGFLALVRCEGPEPGSLTATASRSCSGCVVVDLEGCAPDATVSQPSP